jgi:hypothetical protein
MGGRAVTAAAGCEILGAVVMVPRKSASQEPVARPHPEAVVLDIGGEVGALIVYAGREALDLQIEISPEGDDARRAHQHVLERPLGGRTVYAAVFDRLTEGTYTLWTHGAPRDRRVRVTGGGVAELDWRTEAGGQDGVS